MPVTLTELPIEELVSRESETLAREFEGRVAVDEVHRRMQETVDSLESARIKLFVPLLALRRIRERLLQLTSQV